MLLAVTALLSTSVMLGMVTEASSVSETQVNVAWSHALEGAGSAVLALPAPEQGVPEPFIGPRPDGPGADLPQLRGTALLSGLTALSRAELREFVR